MISSQEFCPTSLPNILPETGWNERVWITKADGPNRAVNSVGELAIPETGGIVGKQRTVRIYSQIFPTGSDLLRVCRVVLADSDV